MSRMDHARVLAVFHRYHTGTPWSRKRAIVELAYATLQITRSFKKKSLIPRQRGDGRRERLTKSN